MVMAPVSDIMAPLFVPATRPDRIAKAARSGADAIVVDLEDAVAAKDKASAREGLANIALPDCPVILRVNATDTTWHQDDLTAAATLGIAGIMLSKSENSDDIAAVHSATGLPVLALVETAAGLANIDAIARAQGTARLAFGSVDFAADLGCAHAREPLLPARMHLVQASRLAGLAAPIDGVTLAFVDPTVAEADARYAAGLGFAGKLCIHPRQVPAVLLGLAPTAADIDWASRILSAADGGAVTVDGAMVDAPVRQRAHRILLRARLSKPTEG